MTKKLLKKKGFHVTVVSWENDGDYYASKTKYLGMNGDTALGLYDICMALFVSKRDGGFGNVVDERYNEEEVLRKVEDLFEDNPKALEALKDLCGENYGDLDYHDSTIQRDIIMDELKSELLGYSDFYFCRVLESCEITYFPEDVYVEVIKTN